MSPIPLNSDAPNGWNPWAVVQTENTTANVFLPDTPLSSVYVPSNAIWLRSLIDHCSLPWTSTPIDAFSTFLKAGGATGSIIGSLGGLAAVHILLSLPPTSTFALGSDKPAPRLGFCIGTDYKHQSYLKIDVIRNELPGAANDIVLGRLDLAQNSRFKRLYLHHGEVERFDVINDEYILSIDLDTAPSSLVGSQVRIVSASGDNLKTTVESVKTNGDLVISNNFSSTFPDTGDYYEFNNVWTLEDPFLMSGFWIGPESDWGTSATNHSGHNLFSSTHNRSYQEGNITGVYTYYYQPDEDPETGITPDDELTSFAVGTPITDVPDAEWRFSGTGASSEIYPDDVRYLINTDSGRFQAMPEGSWDDYLDMLQHPETYSHVRLEISTGGRENRHNWHAPALRGEYLQQDGKFYQILDHVEANIIDVNIQSVDGITLDPTITEYSIFNQNAWMINEHYNGQIGSPEGVYKGTIASANFIKNGNLTNLRIIGVTVPSVMSYVYPRYVPDDISNTFHDRFTKTHDHKSTEPIKAYDKYQDWHLVVGKAEYPITGIASFTDDGVIEMTVTGDLSGFVGSSGFIAFDEIFDAYGSFSSEATMFYDHQGREGTNQICLSSEYTVGPYRLDILSNTRFGFCDGFYFGFGDNIALSARGSTNFITTPSVAGGISSMYHGLLDEDWVVYKDALTDKLTLRRGSLGFTDYPDKTEIIIGRDQEIESLGSGASFTLDVSKDRLRRVEFDTPGGGSEKAFMFTYGSGNYVYGPPISGDGAVSLNALTKSGVSNEDVSSDTYKAGDTIVSPVYVYKMERGIEYRNLLTQDVGIDAKEGTLGVVDLHGGAPVIVNNMRAVYVKNNQSLGEKVGFYDILRLRDGENILIYGSSVGEFTIGDTYYNSSSNSSQWSNPNAVMAISSHNDSFHWGTPLRKGFEDENFQFPIMLLNGCTYYTSVYDPMIDSFVIFAQCFDGSSHYIGCLHLSFSSMLYEIYRCDSPDFGSDDALLSFLYRPPNVEKSSENESTPQWTDSRNEIDTDVDDAIAYDLKVIYDKFVRVIGDDGTESDITFNEQINIASAHILGDGTYVLLYDTTLGVKIAFSIDSGRYWGDSGVILAKQGGGGTLINGNLYYVTPASGIAVKYINETDLYQLRNIAVKNKGITENEAEAILQERFDQFDVDLLGTGQINLQKISGYMDNEGVTRVFYYDVSNNLVSASSIVSSKNKETTEWTIGNNF